MKPLFVLNLWIYLKGIVGVFLVPALYQTSPAGYLTKSLGAEFVELPRSVPHLLCWAALIPPGANVYAALSIPIVSTSVLLDSPWTFPVGGPQNAQVCRYLYLSAKRVDVLVRGLR